MYEESIEKLYIVHKISWLASKWVKISLHEIKIFCEKKKEVNFILHFEKI